ncbi:hypothetical protein SAMD00019534_106490 [Acytostelium subglobosum LB1]|uniref:hypothetical protein n=1 Tax=Acytostelium subglobosum LB1 TaxID=1410327 RepID=UPI000644E150|nr:hypothetical protein SAMD00019534_106490 [Acytostelium subglobosum LB1]GAM27473.1 hypothetical protein SAMD00019534_106490 [Acytostelium subglobosum LB1]|eukprot:XP_012749538.1 hypothetical protein SAMD00019534_106490 [Acytostelium subglobosum LB1]
MDEPKQFKIVLLGNTGVGKSSIFHRLVFNKFNPEYRPTSGTDFLSKPFYVNGTVCNIQFWDTSGEAKYWCLTEVFWRTAHAAVLVYDVTDEKSFKDLSFWLNECKTKCHSVEQATSEKPGIIFAVLGNKADNDRRAVSTISSSSGGSSRSQDIRLTRRTPNQVPFETVGQWCKDNKIKHYFEVSSKDGTGVKESLVNLIEKVLEQALAEEYEDSLSVEGAPLLQDSSSRRRESSAPNSPRASSSSSSRCCSLISGTDANQEQHMIIGWRDETAFHPSLSHSTASPTPSW